MTFIELLANTGSKIIAELLGGTAGGIIADELIKRCRDFLGKKKAYKKFIEKGSDFKQKLMLFFHDLSAEINQKHITDDKKAYKKVKTVEKRTEIMLSEFCLYSGITEDGIKAELNMYAAYQNIGDDNLKQAIVDVLLAMRKYYSEGKLSEDNKALISLLCSDEVTEALAKKIVAQFAECVSLVSGGTTFKDGANVVVKSLVLTKLECPKCGKGLLEELRSSSDKMFECTSCHEQFAVDDFSDDFKTKINNNLAQANDYLKIICEKVDSLLITVESLKNSTVSKDELEKIVETYYEKSKAFLSENINGALSDYLKSESDMLIKEICEKLPSLTAQAIKAAKIKTKHEAIICELKEVYPRSSVIHSEAIEFKHEDAFSALCFEATEVNFNAKVKFNAKKIVNLLNTFPEISKKNFGELIVNFIIQSTILPMDTDVYNALLSFAKGVEYHRHSYDYYKELVDRRKRQGFYSEDFENDMFVACAGEDEQELEELLQYLDEHSTINYFYYKHHLIHDATLYSSKLDAALKKTKCFLFVSSKNSVKPECDAVKYELKRIQEIDTENCKYYLGSLPLEMYDIHGNFPINRWVPRLWYSLDGVTTGKDVATNAKIKKFFGTINIIDRDKDRLITTYDELINDDAWHNPDYWKTHYGIDNVANKQEANEVYKQRDDNVSLINNLETRDLLSLGDYKDLGNGYITFGTYPQSKKANNITIGEVYDKKRGYYLGSDNSLYEKYKDKYYKVEPIKWRVLIDAGSRVGEMFIVADDILDAHRFDESSNNYANSEIRSWLNGAFYNKAFNDNQKSKIVTTNVDNSGASTIEDENEYVCGNTSDKVFLLSNKEIDLEYFGRFHAYRIRKGTDYAEAHNFPVDCSWWWLRSPFPDNSYCAETIKSDGDFYFDSVDYYEVGVVCALKIKP